MPQCQFLPEVFFNRLNSNLKLREPKASVAYVFVRGQPNSMTSQEEGKRPPMDHTTLGPDGYYIYADSALTTEGMTTQVRK